MVRNVDLMKMAELVAATGISKQTIHFYLREGLLSPPVKSSRNMAYYDDRHVAEIRAIKEMQERHYYPLSLIKMVMEGRRAGRDVGEADHLEVFDRLFAADSPGSSDADLSLQRFIEESGLTADLADKLAEAGLIVPHSIQGDEMFSRYDVMLGRSFKRIIDLGLRVEDLAIYREYLDIIRQEAVLAHDRIIANPQQQPHPPLSDINKALDEVKVLLGKQAYREMIMEHRHHDEEDKRGEEK